LWASWTCAAWFIIAAALFKFALPLPHFLEIAITLSGATVFFGSIFAGAYLLLGICLPIRWRLGASVLVINAVFFWIFWHSIP